MATDIAMTFKNQILIHTYYKIVFLIFCHWRWLQCILTLLATCHAGWLDSRSILQKNYYFILLYSSYCCQRQTHTHTHSHTLTSLSASVLVKHLADLADPAGGIRPCGSQESSVSLGLVRPHSPACSWISHCYTHSLNTVGHSWL